MIEMSNIADVLINIAAMGLGFIAANFMFNIGKNIKSDDEDKKE